DDVAALGPAHVGEILVAGELEPAEPVAGVAGVRIGARGSDSGGDRVHSLSPQARVQISDQRLTVSGPSRACTNATAGLAALLWSPAPFGSRTWCPRRAVTRPMLGPLGTPPRRTAPPSCPGTWSSASLTKRNVTSPSITSANSSCGAAYHGESPSIRTVSATYS